jgi:hypothetical protein
MFGRRRLLRKITVLETLLDIERKTTEQLRHQCAVLDRDRKRLLSRLPRVDNDTYQGGDAGHGTVSPATYGLRSEPFGFHKGGQP